MIEIGVALVLLGAILVVAEAHVPSGALGAAGGVALAGGAALLVTGAGGGLPVVLAAVAAAAVVAALWCAIAAPKVLAVRQLRARSGREGLSGRMGVVRTWAGGGGQVFLDGALWRARRSWPDDAEELGEGDPVVVERVSGLTLAVRKAEDWEEPL